MGKIGVAQMVSTVNVEKNLQKVEDFFHIAKTEAVDLILLPENFAFMGLKETDKFTVAESYGSGPIQDKIKDLAAKFGIWVIAGTIPIKTASERVNASCLVYDHRGDCVARYNKIHLFDVTVSEKESHQESLTVEPGNEVVVVDTPVGKIGLSVCYDLRFPELYQQLVIKGAEILSVPSAFTAITGIAHWEVLLRARAIENLCYVLAPNQGGVHENGRHTYGHSMIVEPWGKVVMEKENGTGILIADIDLERLHRLRKDFPCNNHHKFRIAI
ncbi:nitrilase (plasmid) [Legionella adelaidensis]|uniref:Nitrilase n=1 Tax=Legionella adelaidensis TaxID=45056 RepID=A0A0W0R1L2_9GAMM|nr:carbon-nitrogen hydrolase family protein [Legionella adelaidensis]KTC64980.1 nitrilase [Legionella adelaidensis]VEH85340.1 nitrilase [Legionella adelaidensis]